MSPHEGRGQAVEAKEPEVCPREAPTVSSTEKLLWRPPPQHRRQRPHARRRYANEMAAAPACTGRSPLKSSWMGRHQPPRGGVVPE
jgi:hypothetical protein